MEDHQVGGNPLELDPAQMRDLVDQAMKHIVRYIESLPSQPASDSSADAGITSWEDLPELPTPPAELLRILFEDKIPPGYNTASPGYLAYIPAGGIFHAAVADLIANAVNRYVGVWAAAPGLAQIEANVLRWIATMVGYPTTSRGFLTTGGSLANLTAVVTARAARLPEDFLRGALYCSDQVHHSVIKAALLAGLPERNFRRIPTDALQRIRVDLLMRAIKEDRTRGFEPFLLVGNAGTTNTGAVDDLETLADVAGEHRLWFHIDAAYGGFFALTERGRKILRGIEQSDSMTLDPHKALFLPYGNGCLLVRDGEDLLRAHAIHADYMPSMQADPERVDFCLYSPELSRDFRGLRLWLPLKLHGAQPFRRNLDEKLDLALYATSELEKIPEVEIVARPQLSVVAFRMRRETDTAEEVNRLTRDLMDRVNRCGRVYLTGTVLDRYFVIRICVLSFRTHRQHIDAAIEDIRRALADMAREAGPR